MPRINVLAETRYRLVAVLAALLIASIAGSIVVLRADGGPRGRIAGVSPAKAEEAHGPPTVPEFQRVRPHARP